MRETGLIRFAFAVTGAKRACLAEAGLEPVITPPRLRCSLPDALVERPSDRPAARLRGRLRPACRPGGSRPRRRAVCAPRPESRPEDGREPCFLRGELRCRDAAARPC